MQRTRRVKNKNTWLFIWLDSGEIDLNLTFQQCTFEICHWPYTVYGTRSQTLCKTVVFMRFDCGRRADSRIPNRRLDFARVRNFRITLDMAPHSPLWLFLFFTQLYIPPAQSNTVPTVRHARHVRALTDRFAGRRHLSRASTTGRPFPFSATRLPPYRKTNNLLARRGQISDHTDYVRLSVNLTPVDRARPNVVLRPI